MRRLFNDDLKLLINIMKTKIRMKKNQQLHKKLIVSAYAVKRTYVVLTHELRIDNVNIKNFQTSIKNLKKQNEQLHSKLQIERIAGIKKTGKKIKMHFSLIIEVINAATTNRLIKKSLIQNYSHRVCEYFEKNYRLKQCFNCQQYENTDTICKNVMRCAKCAQDHRIDSCKTLIDGKKCAICDDKHFVGFHMCQTRQKKKSRLDRIGKNRLVMHVDTESAIVSTTFTLLTRKRSTEKTTSRINASLKIDNRFAILRNENVTKLTQYDFSSMSLIFNDEINKGFILFFIHDKKAHSQNFEKNDVFFSFCRSANVFFVFSNQIFCETFSFKIFFVFFKFNKSQKFSVFRAQS